MAESDTVADETALVDAESDVRAVIDGETVTVRLVEAHAVPCEVSVGELHADEDKLVVSDKDSVPEVQADNVAAPDVVGAAEELSVTVCVALVLKDELAVPVTL